MRSQKPFGAAPNHTGQPNLLDGAEYPGCAFDFPGSYADNSHSFFRRNFHVRRNLVAGSQNYDFMFAPLKLHRQVMHLRGA
jgi:hypothetical protein